MLRAASLRERVAGHVWTVVPTARDVVWRPRRLAFTEHAVAVVDDRFGPTTVPCSLAVPSGATAVVVLVHGLGGSRHAAYVQRAATDLHRLGFAVLALDLRGADRRGGGFYHVALTEDLAAVCSSPLLSPFARVFVLGFSMGGHAALWFAGARSEPRLRGVAAVCTPLDLAATQQHLDARPLPSAADQDERGTRSEARRRGDDRVDAVERQEAAEDQDAVPDRSRRARREPRRE